MSGHCATCGSADIDAWTSWNVTGAWTCHECASGSRWDEEPCVCDADFTCLADEHDKGRCDACETPGIYGLCCGDHQARMCPDCVERCHP